jgi:hypothetical protein
VLVVHQVVHLVPVLVAAKVAVADIDLHDLHLALLVLWCLI